MKLLTKRSGNNNKKWYSGRIQPKFYLKLIKSLEEFKHGIISAIIIYKTLLYFLESDFNLNDDYEYTAEDARQFYIKREILRAIAAHTCPDIYNIRVTTFSSFLYICDEMQNWGRKNWQELYSAQEFIKSGIDITKFNATQISYTENIEIGEKAEVKNFILDLFNKRYAKYKKKFRDGQDSEQRNFDIIGKIIVKKLIPGTEKPLAEITISILGKNKSDKFEVKYNEHCSQEDKICEEDVKDSIFIKEFCGLVKNEC